MVGPYNPDVEVPNTGDSTSSRPNKDKPQTRPPEPVVYHGTTLEEVVDRPTVEYSPRTFDLRVRFNMAVADRVDTPLSKRIELQAAVQEGIDWAERLFLREPALKIVPSWNWDVPRTGELVTNDLAFNNKRQLHRWLDREYDNVVGADHSEGVMQVLYVDSLNDGDEGVNATAFYPHGMSPLGRKHGLVSELLANNVSEPNICVGEGILAHELGHIFGLKHTFESYGITVQNCNKDYSTTPGSTTLDNGQVNVMDYWGGKRITGFYLNHCQQVRAAEQRDRYLTKDGEVNYRKLKGGR